MVTPDFLIAGAGIAGLSLALELYSRGASVVVLEAGYAMSQASQAAAGMLAVHDPYTPPALLPLSTLSAALYPTYLDRLTDLSGIRVPFQTTSTLQAIADPVQALTNPNHVVPQLTAGKHHFALLAEHSIDPRQLAPALLAAVRNTTIDLQEHTPLTRLRTHPTAIRVDTSTDSFSTAYLIDCMGAWSPAPVTPRKGQMLAVTLPASLPLEVTIRTEHLYIVPRTHGPQAGRAIVGATVENAGFNLDVHPKDLIALNLAATALLPQLAGALFADSWAGLRPATADGLPLLGANPTQPRYLLANGLFRNGILLAPAVAKVMTALLLNEPPPVDLAPFSPTRFRS